MPTVAPSLVVRDPAALLDRHTTRRNTGVPTLSVLVGSFGAGGRAWRRWANSAGRTVVSTTTNTFPHEAWLQAASEHLSLTQLAFTVLAQRTQDDAYELQARWRNKSAADRDQWWLQLNPTPNDPILRLMADSIDHTDATLLNQLQSHGEESVLALLRLNPDASWPGVLWMGVDSPSFAASVATCVTWAMRATCLPIAVVVAPTVWEDYRANAPESRSKTIVREGECLLPTIDENAAEQQLRDAGARPELVPTLVAQTQGDPELLRSTLELLAATSRTPATEEEDNHARSKAEQFVFDHLQDVPELADRFTLNAELDFRFGRKQVEVDLLCASPKIAIEIDGYYHFQDMENYRRDRRKDWELQKHGYLVLRFLATDVAEYWEMIRDRIKDALRLTPPEEPHR